MEAAIFGGGNHWAYDIMGKVKNLRRGLSATILTLMLVGVIYGEAWWLLRTRKPEVGDYRVRAVGSNGLTIRAEGTGAGDLYQQEEVVGGDARPLIIRRYLEKYKSPLADYSELIYELSRAYGFEYYWIPAIGQQESNLCKKIPEGSFNCWGYGIHSRGTLRFDNYEIALRSYAEYLKREYFDKGLNTPTLMMAKYCPNSNGSWARGVAQFVEEMEAGVY